MTVVSLTLTRAERRALADLRRVGRLYPYAGGRFRPTGTGNDEHLYRESTLRTLVTIGAAKWSAPRPGVLSHVVYVGREQRG